MSKLFHEAITLEVKEDIQHKPIAFLYKGGKEGIEEICEQWRASQGWWKRATAREYFRVRTARGIVCEMYRDLLTGAWYLQRIYD
ncbi:MAG: hypothetical protein OEU97_04270 [Dehalococcoidia bacterium]|nr:hypothetical protein [Dehalococcoidia bacterium]MDH4299476.1 hypothetical protein [Dehalococcoidia bacterium]MDH4367786.1 hypothetical protein [Dehalococcoidia bacterium]